MSCPGIWVRHAICTHVHTAVVQREEDFVPPPFTDGQKDGQRVERLFDEYHSVAEAKDPEENEQMTGWLHEFRERREELWHDPSPLRSYWRWMVTTHGHAIMRTFGKFGFINAELASRAIIDMLRNSGSF
eukprot:GHVO01065901.1.p2 GENE.GHVO01065901.1~~GHVO01065901.1.p2  ORF type:complete len:130 (-),score=28.29 GHVO01065901.1:182-571(-)